MSCSVCRLPFVPDLSIATQAIPAHTPPKGVLSKEQAKYFMTGTGVGKEILDCVMKFRYFSSNMFGASGCIVLIWDVEEWDPLGGTTLIAHHVCFALLRHILHADDSTPASITTLCAHDLILGCPQSGANAGRFRDVKYEDAGERVDLSRFWRVSSVPGGNVFDWVALKASPLAWTMNRPDIFPRFHPVLSAERLASVGLPTPDPADLINTLPLELTLQILPLLSAKSYLALTSTCRALRWHALTTFQPHARASSSRCRGLSRRRADATGDWLLYLAHVHRTQSMRVRRWVWALCEEIRRVWLRKLPGSGFADLGEGVKSAARIELERDVNTKIEVAKEMRRANGFRKGGPY
ncbi:hypothetical protein B0H10DRAFT_2428432 [Mycena sp. CBHHK59/15]|nr:hypothetical protein B0H10DRAFT_2428432 [Mycena sp. CBHHK59/15]